MEAYKSFFFLVQYLYLLYVDCASSGPQGHVVRINEEEQAKYCFSDFNSKHRTSCRGELEREIQIEELGSLL